MDLDLRFGTVALEERANHEIPAITGYAAVFWNPDDPGTAFDMRQDGRIFERIMPGAFDGIEGQDVLALLEHDPANLLGRTSAGTLRLTVDARGLRYWIDPPMTALGRQVTVSLQRGDLRASSFGFRVPQGGDIWKHEGSTTVREIRKANVKEVSIVAFPAYGSALSTLTTRAIQEHTSTSIALLKRRLSVQTRF